MKKTTGKNATALHIIGLAGSLRKASYNHALLLAAKEEAPPDLEIDIASIADIPLYNQDIEDERGLPPAVVELKEDLARADGILLVTPEYNGSIPGVLKNAIDWLSRPASDIARVFGDRPVALMGATPGKGGTTLAQVAWLPVLKALKARPWFGSSLLVSRAAEVFSAKGKLEKAEVRKALQDFLSGFASFVRSEASARPRGLSPVGSRPRPLAHAG